MSKRINSVTIDLDDSDPQLATVQNATFIRATLVWDDENNAEVWFEYDVNDQNIFQDRKLLVVERDCTLRYNGYEYLDSVVSGNGKVYHIYQDVVEPLPPTFTSVPETITPTTAEELKKYWPAVGTNYKIVVGMEHSLNRIFSMEANLEGARLFLEMFTGFGEDVVHNVLKRIRMDGGQEELTCTNGTSLFYISVAKIEAK